MAFTQRRQFKASPGEVRKIIKSIEKAGGKKGTVEYLPDGVVLLWAPNRSVCMEYQFPADEPFTQEGHD